MHPGSGGLSVAQVGKPGPGSRKGLLSEEGGRTGQASPPAWGVETLPLATIRATGFGSGKLAWRKTPGSSLLRGGELGEWHIGLEQRPHSVVGRARASLEKWEDLYSKPRQTKGRQTQAGQRGGAPGSYSQPSAGPRGKFTSTQTYSPGGQREAVGLSLSTPKGMPSGGREFHEPGPSASPAHTQPAI